MRRWCSALVVLGLAAVMALLTVASAVAGDRLQTLVGFVLVYVFAAISTGIVWRGW